MGQLAQNLYALLAGGVTEDADQDMALPGKIHFLFKMNGPKSLYSCPECIEGKNQGN